MVLQCGGEQQHPWQKKAEAMVNEQIIGRGLQDSAIIAVMKQIPRHQFVPKRLQDYAYEDGPLPIGYGQTISQPYIVALMTDLLELNGNEKVLEIGTGSGYQAAVLAHLCDSVYTMEIIEPLCKKARERLEKMGYKNIVVICGDGYEGYPQAAPYDRIIITAAPVEIPKKLIEQLKIGGIMVLPVGAEHQMLQRVIKTEKGIEIEDIIPVRFVPMVPAK